MAVTLRAALKSNGTLIPYITTRCGDLWTVDFTCAGLMPTGHAGDMNVTDVIRVSLPQPVSKPQVTCYLPSPLRRLAHHPAFSGNAPARCIRTKSAKPNRGRYPSSAIAREQSNQDAIGVGVKPHSSR